MHGGVGEKRGIARMRGGEGAHMWDGMNRGVGERNWVREVVGGKREKLGR